MDLAKIKPIEKDLNLRDPANDEPTGMIVTLACVDDERVQSGMREASDWALKCGSDMTKAQEREYDNRIGAAYIVDVRFEGDAVWFDETPDYSPKLALEIMSIPSLKRQILKEASRIKDFYKA